MNFLGHATGTANPGENACVHAFVPAGLIRLAPGDSEPAGPGDGEPADPAPVLRGNPDQDSRSGLLSRNHDRGSNICRSQLIICELEIELRNLHAWVVCLQEETQVYQIVERETMETPQPVDKGFVDETPEKAGCMGH